MRKSIVDHQVVDISMADTSLLKSPLACHPKCPRTCEVGHLANHGSFHTFTRTQNVNRLMGKVGGPVGARQDQCTTTIRYQATLKLSKRIGDHAVVQHLLDGDGFSVGSTRIQCRPFALDHCHHGQLLKGGTGFVHIPKKRDGKR